MKKRQKVRSPSILKNGSRNILNGSLIAGSVKVIIFRKKEKDHVPSLLEKTVTNAKKQ